jgi:3-hydroxyisobutyrate dehydrogenase
VTGGTPDAVIVVGLGQMGGGMASSLARAGVSVLGVDPLAAVSPGGDVERCTLPEALERASVLVLSLPGGDQVQEVTDLLAGHSRPCLVVDTSTCDPLDTRRRAGELAAHDHVLVDAPVSGGPSGARAGELTVFLGCPEGQYERVGAVLEPLASRVNRVGDVGAGHTAKLVNNLLCGIHLCAARALLEVGEAAGIDPALLLSAVNSASGRSAVTEVNLPRWVLSDTFDSGFPVGLMARDVSLAVSVAQSLGVSSEVAGAATQMWADLLERVGPSEDFNRMVRA